MKEENKQEYWIAIGTGVGVAIGIIYGLNTNLGLCIAVGISFGSIFVIIIKSLQIKK